MMSLNLPLAEMPRRLPNMSCGDVDQLLTGLAGSN